MDQDFGSGDPFAPHREACCSVGGLNLMMIVGMAVLLFILGMIIGDALRKASQRRSQDQVLDDIYEALMLHGRAAAAATSDNIIGAASALRADIERRLGALATPGGSVKSHLEALKKGPDTATGTAKAEKDKAGPTSVMAGAGVFVTTTPPPAEPKPPSAVDQARLAIGAFNDHWSKRRERIEELRKARDALLDTPPVPRPFGLPKPPPPPGGSGGGGGGPATGR